jgi:glycosyltransferase involved in cell wall biosynthesis
MAARAARIREPRASAFRWTIVDRARILRAMVGRVALLSPFAFPSVRGNAVTVDRIARGLQSRDVDVRVWDVSAVRGEQIDAELHAFAPAIVHAFHAGRTGPLAFRFARAAEVPLVVTLTGTDANHDLFDAERAVAVRHVLEGAAAIAVFHESLGRRVSAALPEVADRITVVPQAVQLPEGAFDLEAHWRLPAERVLFVFPAGIRPVKRPLMPLEPFDRLVARHPVVRLAYAGPVLDPAEGDRLVGALAPRPWARYLGSIPHHAMASLLRTADVVLNCSESEGGMANAVLEAQSVGRAVLASSIDGNRSLVEHGVSGLLFRDERELEEGAGRLAGDETLRTRLGAAGRARVLRDFPIDREIDGYLSVYWRVTQASAAPGRLSI